MISKHLVSLFVVCLLLAGGAGTISMQESVQETPLDQQHETVTTTETYRFSPPTLSMRDGQAAVTLSEATSMSGQPGAPRLPVATRTFLFPFGTRIDSVDVTYHDIGIQQLHQPIEVADTPQITSIHVTEQTSTPASYDSGQPFPARPYAVKWGAGLVDGERATILTVNMYPVQYRPDNRIAAAARASVTFSYTVPAAPVLTADEYDLLVLAPSGYADALQPLLDYKNDHGTPAMLTTLDDIPETGDDVQESIKLYIKEAIETWGITSVLLVGGGVDDGVQFPVRNAWISSGSYEDNFPSDLYYADIYDANGSLSTWDANDNGKYAEYEADMSAVDVYPDVYLGRLPATSASQVSAVVDKILDYEEHNKMLNTIVQIGGDTFPGDREGINEGEYANEQVMERLPGYEATQLWASTDTLKKGKIITNFYRGADYVDFSGHGSPVSWATHPPDDDSIWLPKKTLYSPYSGFLYVDASWVFNVKKLPVVVLNACSCSKFTETANTLAWSVVKKQYGGAIASYGASGIGYGSHGSSETDRLFGWMEVNLLEGLYEDKVLGLVWGNALTEYASSFDLDGADYKTLLEMTLFGDPTLAIEDGPNPDSLWP
ncbi:MAG: C25 family cysteine peptidase [Thermoplasmatota archaeon]